MTHDILRSDIDLATRLRDDQRPDHEIISALVHRGVDPGKAAQLVDDLRKGIKPTPQSSIPMEMTLPRRSRAKNVPPGKEPAQPSRSARTGSRREPPARPTVSGRRNSAGFWLKAAIFAGLVIAAGSVILIQFQKASTVAPEVQPPKAAMPKGHGALGGTPVTAAATGQQISPAPLVLELLPDGLHLGGSLVTGANVLTAVANLLGIPTRTNQVQQTDTVIYAYDQQGLLIYCQKGGGTNRIVLDCDASGGDNGTTSPFVGALKVEDQVISPGTDSQTLAAIKCLGLTRPGTSDTILGGRYNGLDLVFAYLNSPQRLSFIAIDLK